MMSLVAKDGSECVARGDALPLLVTGPTNCGGVSGERRSAPGCCALCKRAMIFSAKWRLTAWFSAWAAALTGADRGEPLPRNRTVETIRGEVPAGRLRWDPKN